MKRLSYRNGPDWVDAWKAYATDQKRPPQKLVVHYGVPSCARCWDTGFCNQCLGRYPQYCPENCGDGTCTCDAGQARRAAYRESLKEAGLA